MFKKYFYVFASAIVLAIPAVAQDNDSGFKPQAKDITTEVQLNLFGNNNTIGINQIRGRYFLSPTTALRLGADFNTSSNTDNNVERSSTQLRVASGIEKHFAGTEKLSPYIGVEIAMGKTFAGEKGPDYEILNGMQNGISANFSTGINAVVGADYYIARRLYLGVEFGYGFSYFSYNKVERKPAGGSPLMIREESSSFNLGTRAVSGLRLGFAF